MAGRLRQPDVSGNHCGEDLAGKVLANLLGHLGGEVGSAIEHGQCHAKNFKPGIHPLFHHPQGAHKVAEPLQGEILALHRHQNPVRRAQAIQRQQLQRWGAVNKNNVVVFFCPEQGFFQLALPVLRSDQFNSRTGQIRRRGEYVAVIGVNHRFFQGNVVDGHIVGGIFDSSFIQSQTGCGVGLWVKVA